MLYKEYQEKIIMCLTIVGRKVRGRDGKDSLGILRRYGILAET